jgi:hypothetical protein
VKRPIGIDSNDAFRHIYRDELDVNRHSIKELIDNGTKPLEEFYEKWSPTVLRKEMEALFNV